MARPAHLELLERYLGAIRGGDASVVYALRSPGYEELFPQSGERIRGRETVAAVERAYPSPPTFEPPTHVTSLGADSVVVESPAIYDGQTWWVVARLELEDGLVAREVAYFGEAFDALPYRASWVERYDPRAEAGDRSEPGPDDAVDRHDVEALASLFERGEMTGLDRFFGPDWVGEYPQSGERFRGGESMRLAHDPYPGGLPVERVLDVSGPEERMEMTPFAPVSVHGLGSCWMIEVENLYPDGSRWFQVIVSRARRGRMHRTRWYWCEPFEPPAWRSPFVEGAGRP